MQTHGTGWSDIQKLHFPSRSTNSVKNTFATPCENLVFFIQVSDGSSFRYTILKNKNLDIPPGAAPCCPPVADSTPAILNSEQSPLGSDFACFLDYNDQTETDFPDLGDFDEIPTVPHETQDFSRDPFSLSYAETDQHSLQSPAAFTGLAFDSTTKPFLDGDSSRPSSSRDFCNGIEAPSYNRRQGKGSAAAWQVKERQQLMASHRRTSEEAESQVLTSLQPVRDPMQIDYRPDAEPTDSSVSVGTRTRCARSRRTTIHIESIASETLVEVMGVLINANAKVKLETE